METFLTKGLKPPDMQKSRERSSSVVRQSALKVAFCVEDYKIRGAGSLPLIARPGWVHLTDLPAREQ